MENRSMVGILAVITAMAGVLFLGTGCRPAADEGLARRMLELESRDYSTRMGDDARLVELLEAIERYRSIVEEKVYAADKLAEYQRMLALAYLDRGMYELSLRALEEAILVLPESSRLFVLKAAAAGRMAKAMLSRAAAAPYLELSEKAYLRAIALDPGNSDALYGLGILYVFELDRPQDAVVHLERLVERERHNAEAMFVLARAYVSLHQPEQAIELYDRIIDVGQAVHRAEAERLKRMVLEANFR